MSVRMNDALRQRLTSEVAKLIHLPELGRQELDAYNIVSPLVRGCVYKKYPKKDMEVCAKYGVAKVDDCIDLQLTEGGVDRFHFTTETGPLVVKRTYHGQVYAADEQTTAAFHNWKKIRENHEIKLKALRADYLALIKGARTLEEIVEIWPEAASVMMYARSQALTVLSQDVINRIKTDVARRSSEDGDA